jgi:CRP-like cAMP-binding protein
MGGDAGATPESFLGALTPDERGAQLVRGTVRSFERGVALFHERQASDRVVVLRSGRVKLTSVTENGREILLAIAGPGDVLGELSALDDQPRSATAIAIEQVEAVTIAPSDLVAFLESCPHAALGVIRQLARRLRDADRKRVEFAAQDSVGRVAARLVELCERFGEETNGTIHIDLPLSQDELAGWIGSSREAVAKALQTLRRLGWIETHRREITVLDLESVRRRANP